MLMSTLTIVVIVVVIVVAAALVTGVLAYLRRRRLQQRFGPEYDRLAGERDSKLKADAELTQRERRVRELDIRPLTEAARAGYADQWAGIQERFVDAPAGAVAGSRLLVVAVMTERGYPAEQPDQVLADLSVAHASSLDSYRAAEEISRSAASGTASTEDLRQAMIHYRALFADLLGEPADAQSGSAATGPAQIDVAADATPMNGDAQVAGTQPAQAAAPASKASKDGDAGIADAEPAVAAGDPVADGASQQSSDSDIREMTR
jgi:hypothetical protein